MLEMAFYWSLFFTQFSDVKRKDFTEMFIHHLATLALLTLSWTTQMFREDLGTFITKSEIERICKILFFLKS